ncbi:enoyl-CoA hydratase-related protein [Gordonia sp. (in: high G+C Gram-positive bacteria)]|uniref:enoyl-CoA hydratase-related protein n=1 Tax=Gordonia sp. (in: high G+C Gram-positive bacteria) TaxID=84139 RepID=UPI003F9AD61F
MNDDLLVRRDGAVVSIVFNRPSRFNALTLEVVESATTALEAADTDPTVRLITLTGAGSAFCAGADLADGIDPANYRQGEPVPVGLVDAVNRFTLAMRTARPLVVALVNGVAAGVGSSFVLGADLAVASDAARLKTAFAGIGLMPDGGGTAYLAAALGRNRALAVAILDDEIDAAEALRAGLVARVWPADDFDAESTALIERLAAGPTAAFAAIKRGIDACALADLPEALERERREQRTLLGSRDFASAVAAFRTRERVVFTGA